MQKPHEFKDLTAVPPERRRYFTPGWFRKLLAAKLSFGDTFWIGSFGTALFFVPGMVLLVLLARIVFSVSMAALVSGAAMLALALYYAALAVAVFRTALPRTDVGGWRWAGVAVTIALTVGTGFLALALLGDM